MLLTTASPSSAPGCSSSARPRALSCPSSQMAAFPGPQLSAGPAGRHGSVRGGEALRGLVASPEPEEVLRGTWNHLLAGTPPGDELPLLHRRERAPRPCLQVAQPVLVVPVETVPRPALPTIQAQPGPKRALPLGQPQAPAPGASPPVYLP